MLFATSAFMKCQAPSHRRTSKDSGAIGDPTGSPKNQRCPVLQFLGLCCVGFCSLAMPLLAVVAPALGMDLHDRPWIVWPLMLLSLGIYGLGLAGSRARHRHWGPALVATLAASLLIASEALPSIPKVTNAFSAALLLAAWGWDRKLSKEVPHGSCDRS